MRTFALSLTLLLLVQVPAQAGDVITREGKGYLLERADGQRVLHLKGTPYEMGYQQGKLLTKAIKTTMGRIVDNKGELGKSKHYQLYRDMRPMMHNLLRKHIPQRFKDEMRGVADASGLSYADVEAGNLFPAAFHCSGIALKGKATKDGSLYHVRILDYMTKLGLQENALVIVHEPDGYRKWLNVGFAGFIGSVTGMNANQVAIGEMGGGGLLFWDGMPMAFLIRDALERAGTLKEAVKIFKTTKRTCEYYYVISDGKTRDATGIWATPEAFETVKPGETFSFIERAKVWGGAADQKAFVGKMKVDVSKHRILFRGKDAAGKHRIKGFIAMPPADSLVISGPDRYQHFVERLVKNYGKVDHTLLQKMVKRPVSMKSNLHVAIFHPETLEVWVAVAAKDGSPACNQPYYRYTLKAPTASKK